MINELLSSELFVLLLRLTLITLVGYVAIASFRNQLPSLSVVIARVLLVAIWVAPLAVLLGWSLDVAVLPAVPNSQDGYELAEFGQAEAIVGVEANGIASNLVGLEMESSLAGSQFTDSEASVVNRSPISNSARSVSESAAVTTPLLSKASHSGFRLSDVSLTAWLCGLWLLGTSCLLVNFICKWLRTAFCIRRSTACDVQTATLASEVADRLYIAKPVAVRISNSIHGPCTVGWIRPLVLLPESWMKGLPKDQTKMILAHELTHAQHRDSGWDTLAQLTSACWWFLPLVFAIARQHRLACEHRCDAAATEIAGGSQSYRVQLAKWALAIRDSRRGEKLAALAGLPMAERPLLLKRLSWLEAAGEDRDISSIQKGVIATGLAAFCTLVSIAHPTQRLLAQEAVAAGEIANAVNRQQSEANSTLVPELKVQRKGMEHLTGKAPELDWDKQVFVNGTVFSESGERIPNAEVMITELIDQKGVWCLLGSRDSVRTNARGELKVILPSGSREFGVRVLASGFEMVTRKLPVNEKIEVGLKAVNGVHGKPPGQTAWKQSLDSEAARGMADSLSAHESKTIETEAVLRARREAEFKDTINSFSEFRPSQYLELEELSIVSGGKTDKGDYLFVCDTKVVWRKSRKELMKKYSDFIIRFSKKHEGSIMGLAVVGTAMQASVIDSIVPKFESGDIQSNRKIRVRGERAGDSIIVTSVTPKDFMIGSSDSGVALLLQSLQKLESNELPVTGEKKVPQLKIEVKVNESQLPNPAKVSDPSATDN